MTIRLAVLAVSISALIWTPALRAQDDDAVRAMARKAQDPLADIKALMTDNTIGFNGGPGDDTSYGFQLQPVYSIENDSNFNMIARGILPIIGVDPGVVLPPIGPNPRPEKGNTWGIGDTILQYFFNPKTDAKWKWGVGPQVSLKTRTSSRQAGPGWGAGAAGIVFGGVGNWGLGAIVMQHWGDENAFSMASTQLIALYNFESIPGAYIGYNNLITYDWKATSGNKLTLPLGVTVGKTFLVNGKDGFDLLVGAYKVVERPDGAPDWQLKFGISYFFN